ncbi:MAG: tetratricopeptide repeat protein [Acidobacteriota bacterium]
MTKIAGAVVLSVAVASTAFGWKFSDGREAYDQGNYAFAVYIWNSPEVAEHRSNREDPWYYKWLALAYLQLGEHDSAIASARKGLGLGPSGDVASWLHWILGKALLAAGRPGEALAPAQASIAATPQDPWSYQLLADVQFALRRYDDAITTAKRVIELKPVSAAYATIAASFHEKGDFDAGLEAVRQGLATAPEDSGLLRWLGHLSYRTSRFEEAASAFEKAGDRLWLALSRYAQGRYDDVLSQTTALIRDAEQGRVGITLSPDRPFIAAVLPGSPAARAGLRVGDTISKVDDHAVGKSTGVAEVAAYLMGPPGSLVALKFHRPGKMTQDKVEVRRELVAAEDAAAGHALQSLCYRAKGELDRASASADKAVALDSSGNWARTAHGFALLEAGRIDEAQAVFQTDTHLQALPFRQVGRALCIARRGEIDQAGEAFARDSAAWDTRNAPLRREVSVLVAALEPSRRAHVERARALEAQGQVAEALTEIAAALRLAGEGTEGDALRATLFSVAAKLPTPPELPDEARRHVVRGELLIKEGALKDAVREFEQALRLAPYVPKLYYNAALLHGQLKRYPEAMQLMKAYLQAAPDAPDARAAQNEIFAWELQLERQGAK